jgi:hypothetical protein
MSMNDLSWTCEPVTLPDTPNAISSPASADGPMPCAEPAGTMTDLFGQPLAPVSPSVSPAAKKALRMKGISGRKLLGSSASADLQRSLANKLRARLNGSVSCEVIWMPWDTPWGLCQSRPQARARTISEIDIGLWPTVVANDDNKTPEAHLAMKQRMGERDGTGANRTAITSLQVMTKAIALGLWPTATATASDHKSRSASQATLERNARPLREVVFALWSTIRASDGEKGGPNQSFGAGGSPLPSQVSTIGNTLNAPTENGGGSLHPEFAGWEMGYPPEWISCAPSETRSTLARRRRS